MMRLERQIREIRRLEVLRRQIRQGQLLVLVLAGLGIRRTVAG